MELSVIICVYNTEPRYLKECLRSIRESTLYLVDHEICIVDDGSDIDYRELAREYGARYIKCERRGIYLTRLEGIRAARGEYLIFVDSDDCVTLTYHRSMLECAERESADIVYGRWAYLTERTAWEPRSDDVNSAEIYADGAKEALELFFRREGKQHSYYVLWNKLVRTSLALRASHELLRLVGEVALYNYSEDALICFFLHLYASRIRSTHSGYYLYRVHSGQSVDVTSEEKLGGQIRQMAKTLRIMQTTISNTEHNMHLARHIAEWRALMSRTHYSYARRLGYTGLYADVRDYYGISTLEVARYSDGAAYIDARLLPRNIKEIDRVLFGLYSSGESVTVRIPSDRYTRSALAQILLLPSGLRTSTECGTVLPMASISRLDRILYSAPVRRFAARIFPKGTGLRRLLKRLF